MHNHRNKGHPEFFFVKKKKKKGAALARISVFETRLIDCQNNSAISRKKVWQESTLGNCCEVSKRLTRTFILVLVG